MILLLMLIDHDDHCDDRQQHIAKLKLNLIAPSSRKPATMQQVPVKKRHLNKILEVFGGKLCVQ